VIRQVGDRVELVLPDRSLRRGQSRRIPAVTVPGTVTEVDPPGLPPGVRIALDRTVNGVDTCYATVRETRLNGRDHGRSTEGGQE
jgi:hypothetical protein